jgi:hypothetical protein
MHHDYFRKHEGLAGKTPAEIAGIEIEGRNKWINAIQNASKLARLKRKKHKKHVMQIIIK